MREETVKVYKNKENKTIVPRELDIWNKAGYFTSSQQKKSAEEAKALKEAEAKKAAEEKENK